QLDNTMVVITGDNGLPFPRAKANVYDAGSHQPFAVRFPGKVKAGSVIDEFVVLTDLAPTFLEAAGLKPPAEMTGRSFLPLPAGQKQIGRDKVFLERERHANVRRGDLSYPVRAVRTKDFLYIRNLRPDRWPAGDPTLYFAVGDFGDIDGGPSKELLLSRRDDPLIGKFFKLAMDKRPAEELYDLKKDPWEINNVADKADYAAARRKLRAELDKWMRDTKDPRAISDDDRWDQYRYFGNPEPPKRN
ncbi:MAG TPA: sulfatase-like hydrolase/transferase, partial [Blastocatellia bacterium]|nr:sulfatase-like hydrolase/transferase [Blastocatellia bacterium]